MKKIHKKDENLDFYSRLFSILNKIDKIDKIDKKLEKVKL